MPYRLDLFTGAGDDVLNQLVELGAWDVDLASDGRVAALLPDSVAPEEVARALGVADFLVSPAVGRDAGSVWVLEPRPIQIGHLRIVPAHMEAGPGDLRLADAAAFGTGLHATTALCLEALQETIRIATPEAVLDVGTGSGVLALAMLLMGVPWAMGIDIDDEALRAAAENARINGLDERLQLACGGPAAVAGTWPLVVANVLAAPLIEIAPALARRIGHQGQLVLSGIASSLEADVDRAYRRLGMRRVRAASRSGWVALVLQATW